MAEKKKSNSLLESGFTVELGKGEVDSNGLEIIAVVYKPMFIKKTKRGKLKAYHTLDGTVQTGVDGLYTFEAQANGDFTGKRSVPKKAEVAA
jgi:hypothetical protein